MKKITSLFLIAVLFMALFTGCNPDYSSVETHTMVIDGVSYSTGSVTVVLKEGYADPKYRPSDFDKKLVKSVEVYEFSEDYDNLWIELKLRNPSEENIMKVIEIAEAKPEVDHARPNCVFTVIPER